MKMDCCNRYDCEKFSVTPVLLTPCAPVKCCESAPMYVSCLPSCSENQIIYCCERPQPCSPRKSKICYDGHCDDSCRRCPDVESRECCPTCHRPTTPPVKTKYIMPCYQYEDGRIEQYVPKVHGRLPTSVYKRNGVQDQINGYRGAIRYLCAVEKQNKHYICSVTEPIKRLYPKITQEVFPVKHTFKRN